MKKSLDPETRRPRNAMIIAGANAATSLVLGSDQHDRFARIHDFYSTCAGRTLEIDDGVHQSEPDTSNRNRAIGFLLREIAILNEEPGPIIGSVYGAVFASCPYTGSCGDDSHACERRDSLAKRQQSAVTRYN